MATWTETNKNIGTEQFLEIGEGFNLLIGDGYVLQIQQPISYTNTPKAGAVAWLKTIKEGDSSVPTRTLDLAITGVTSSSITIEWTETADNSGTLGFDVRYSTSNINALNWSTRTQATGIPTPQGEGTVHTMTISGLLSGTTYYVGLKSYDLSGNYSLLSNVPSDTTL